MNMFPDNNRATAHRFSQSNKAALRNPWVIGLGSAVLVVVVVNIIFITMAIATNPGLVEDNYYERGQDHALILEKRIETRNRLGWQLKFEPAVEPVIGNQSRFHFTVVDRSGLPVSQATAQLNAYRPSDASADFSQPMEEFTAGLFSAVVTFPLKGHWDVTARVSKGDDSLELTQRIDVAPR